MQPGGHTDQPIKIETNCIHNWSNSERNRRWIQDEDEHRMKRILKYKYKNKTWKNLNLIYFMDKKILENEQPRTF